MIAVEGDQALVETRRKSSCGGCSARAGCGTALLAKVFGSRRSALRVANRVRAKRGEGVIVGLPESALTLGSLLVYILPLFAMITGAGLGRWLGVQASSLPAEPASIVGGALGLVAGLYGTNRIGKRMGTRRGFQAEILRVVPGVAVPITSLGEQGQES